METKIKTVAAATIPIMPPVSSPPFPEVVLVAVAIIIIVKHYKYDILYLLIYTLVTKVWKCGNHMTAHTD